MRALARYSGQRHARVDCIFHRSLPIPRRSDVADIDNADAPVRAATAAKETVAAAATKRAVAIVFADVSRPAVVTTAAGSIAAAAALTVGRNPAAATTGGPYRHGYCDLRCFPCLCRYYGLTDPASPSLVSQRLEASGQDMTGRPTWLLLNLLHVD